jgi:hypothetical protein
MSRVSSPQPPTIAGAGETGALGIVYLKRFWSQKIIAQTQAIPGGITASDLVAENVLLAGLRLGVRETLDFLMQAAPSFEEFEAWVRTKNGGTIAPARVERLNGA